MEMKIGLIGAMDLEVEILLQKMQLAGKRTKAGMTFCEGTLAGKKIVLVQCGVGKVNAAVCAQILCDDYGVTHIINTGVAGGLLNEMNIGDVVVSTEAVQHDMDVTNLGYKFGEIPDLPLSVFSADKTLVALAAEANRAENPDIATFCGRVLSGDQFISSAERKQFIVSEFRGVCVEMEGAAVAQTAWLNGVPFVILRAISDKADHSAEMDYPKFKKMAAAHSARLVEDLLKRL